VEERFKEGPFTRHYSVHSSNVYLMDGKARVTFKPVNSEDVYIFDFSDFDLAFRVGMNLKELAINESGKIQDALAGKQRSSLDSSEGTVQAGVQPDS
tara:strand:- start:2198 stop:2488 length:291 start_codon:yes stop_codon:yes gene_type:complete